MEVMCNVRVLETVLNLQTSQPGGAADNKPSTTHAKKIRAGFQASGSAERLLQDNCRPDLNALLPSMLPLLNGMLNIDVEQRWDGQRVLDHLAELPVAK